MRRTDRLFELIQLFRGGRLLRGQDLAEHFSVSVRTIYRDIDTLLASGVPIEGERGVGYVLRTPIFLPPLTLSETELEALQIGVSLLSRTGDEQLRSAAKDLVKKVDAVLPDEKRGRNYVSGLGIYSPESNNTGGLLPQLRMAIREKRKLQLAYERLSDRAESRRIVRPLHLEYWGYVWTLTAWCELRNDFRVFRVDHIRAADLGDDFKDEPGKTLTAYVVQAENAKDQGA
ncbi:MAG: YafY family protein [Pseudomonadota bacterium]